MKPFYLRLDLLRSTLFATELGNVEQCCAGLPISISKPRNSERQEEQTELPYFRSPRPRRGGADALAKITMTVLFPAVKYVSDGLGETRSPNSRGERKTKLVANCSPKVTSSTLFCNF
jgi:hypothetical protein